MIGMRINPDPPPKPNQTPEKYNLFSPKETVFLLAPCAV